MELSPSREAASRSASQELLNILWNPNVHYRVNKSLPLVPILSRIQSIAAHPVSLTSIIILFSHLRLGFPSGLFPSGFPAKILYTCTSLFPHARYMPCPSYAYLFEHSPCIWRRVQVMKLLLMQFSPTSYHFIPIRSKFSPQHPVLKYPLSMEFPTVTRTIL
jgi:hypothetical protein